MCYAFRTPGKICYPSIYPDLSNYTLEIGILLNQFFFILQPVKGLKCGPLRRNSQLAPTYTLWFCKGYRPFKGKGGEGKSHVLERTRKGNLGEREGREGCVSLSNLLPKRLQDLSTSPSLSLLPDMPRLWI